MWLDISFENKEHQMVHLDWVKSLRSSLVEYFTHVSLPDFTRACDKYVNEIVAVWRFIFLNVQSPLHLDAEKFVCPKEFFQYERNKRNYHRYDELPRPACKHPERTDQ